MATLRALTEGDLLRVLTEPKNALVRQYEELFRTSNVECRFVVLPSFPRVDSTFAPNTNAEV